MKFEPLWKAVVAARDARDALDRIVSEFPPGTRPMELANVLDGLAVYSDRLLAEVRRLEGRQLKVYVASSLANHEAARTTMNELMRLGFLVSYDWTQHPSAAKGPSELVSAAHHESCAVADSDFVIALLPGGRGTHVEIGMGLASEKCKRVFVLGTGDDFNVPYPCAFYHHTKALKVNYNPNGSVPIPMIARQMRRLADDAARG